MSIKRAFIVIREDVTLHGPDGGLADIPIVFNTNSDDPAWRSSNNTVYDCDMTAADMRPEIAEKAAALLTDGSGEEFLPENCQVF